MNWPFKTIRFKKPVAFDQWNLSEAIKGLRIEVDSKGDALTLPVFVLDVTKNPVLTASLASPIDWQYGSIDSSDALSHVLIPGRAGSQIMLSGFIISFGAPVDAAATLLSVTVSDTSASMEWDFEVTIPIAAIPMAPIVVVFSNPIPLHIGDDLLFQLGNPLAGGKIMCTSWGYYT